MLLIQPWNIPPEEIVNDVTQINPVAVAKVAAPANAAEVQELVKNHEGKISVGGGRFSMGGQTATEGALQIDMRGMDKIIHLDKDKKHITVEAGITWRKLQEYIDPHGLSVKIMQTYSNFTVGGSLSVNVHGRYVGQGPIILSVDEFKIVLADGSLVKASRDQNSDIFYGAIGGYGGLGVIVEATLQLEDNVKVKRHVWRIPANDYKDFFTKIVRDNPQAVFHNGDIYPPDYNTVGAVTWMKTDEALTQEDRFVKVKPRYWLENLMYLLISEVPGGKTFRKNFFDTAWYDHDVVQWRNYEASYDVRELEPPSRFFSTYVLNEYFIPIEKFDEFVPKMAEIFGKHDVNVINVSIRHALPDRHSLLSWAATEKLAFVVYYKQGTSEEAKRLTGEWTREMADAILSVGGSWYLPYQPHATVDQFLQAYPRASEFFELKARLDPSYKFRNKLWDKYYYRSENERKAKAEAQAYVGYKRPEDQTYLTLPEWYIVFSPDEYAQSLKKQAPSAFPYFSSISQFWKVYHHVIRETWHKYPYNWGYHAMICVIGASYSAELALKGIYENTIGRLTEWIAGRQALDDEMVLESYQQKVAQDYVDFIRIHPWYEYPFFDNFKEYWSLKETKGLSKLRAAERRFFFSAELLVKAAYGWLIGLGTQAAYGTAENEIGAMIEEEKVVKFTTLPRYQAFTEKMPEMIKQGIVFHEIAGNKTILVTFIAPRGWQATGQNVMYEWPILTDNEKKRVALSLPVEKMDIVIPALLSEGLTVDHVFDY